MEIIWDHPCYIKQIDTKKQQKMKRKLRNIKDRTRCLNSCILHIPECEDRLREGNIEMLMDVNHLKLIIKPSDWRSIADQNLYLKKSMPVFCWRFLPLCSPVILACKFLCVWYLCLVLVSGWLWLHRMSLQVFHPRQFFGRVWEGWMLALL